MMRLAEPAWLAAAGLALVAAVVWWLRRRWQRYPFPVVGRRAMAVPIASIATLMAGLLAACALVPLAVAAARPQEVLARQQEHAEGVDLVVVLDVSGSMAALDFRPSNRLAVAKEVISGFIERRPYDRIGLVAFAGAAVTLCPLTLDHHVALELLDKAGLRTLPDGTAIGLGLGTAVTRLRRSSARSKVIVLVTDGASNAGQLDPMSAADLAASEGITVHTVLVGSGGTVPIPITERDPRTGEEHERVVQMEVETNPELLAQIARTCKGQSFTARDSKALAAVFREIDGMEKTEFTSTRLVRYRERFEPWALAAFGLLAAALLVEGIGGRTPW